MHARSTLSLSLSLGSLAASSHAQAPLIHTLVSAYTPGEQLSLELTPDGTRGFLAEGATIVVLNMTPSPPVELARYQVPETQPLAMRYHHSGQGADYLFLAGGAHGVRRLTLCSSWFHSPPVLCSVDDWGDLLVQAPLESGYFERKRCVDVDILETSNGPVLFALFAASSDANESAGGPTELRAYTWTSTTASQVASFTFPCTDHCNPPPSSALPVAVGTSLAVDPADNDSIYVGMGKGGIWRADFSGTALAATQVWLPAGCSQHAVQHVRDLSVVRVATATPESVLYAALNYNELLEIRGLGGSSPSCATVTVGSSASQPPGLAECVAAIIDGGTRVLVALASQATSGKEEDGFGPRNVNSMWTSICLKSGLDDVHVPNFSPNAPEAQLQVYAHEFAPGGGGLTLLSTTNYSAVDEIGMGWNDIALRDVAGSSAKRMVLCSRELGTQVCEVNSQSGSVTVGPTILGEAFSGQDSVSSTINNGVVTFCQEWVGAVLPPRQMAYIDPVFPFEITTIPQTEHSPCANDYPTPPAGANCAGAYRDPDLYAGGIFEVAHFLDPNNAGREFLVTGRKLLERVEYDPLSQTCSASTSCALVSPCNAGGNPWWWLRLKDYGGQVKRSGWMIASLALPSSGPPVDGPSMQARWWQLDLPTLPTEAAAPTDDRVQTLADPRTDSSGLPTVLYLSRSGTSHVKVVETPKVVAQTVNSCVPPGTASGVGEFITAESTAARTHPELEVPMIGTPPAPGIPCTPTALCSGKYVSTAKILINEHTTVFETKDLGGAPMFVLASASGFPASASDPSAPQPADCQWISHAGRPMLVLLDVTATGDGSSFSEPQMLRIGLGDQEGHAFCVQTKTVGLRTYAFVGDILGRIWVYLVSGTQLLPPPTLPYRPANDFLTPIFKLELPCDPFDGVKANCIDLELVGDFLYCALGRNGVGIVDISDPKAPGLIDVIDTPGLVLGLSTRIVMTSSGPVVQLIVGDSRCGVRIYQ